MLKTVRIIFAALCLTGLALLFAGISGPAGSKLNILAAIQFGPAVISGSFVIIGAIVASTFIFGRLYCSVICPLGIMQDLISTLAKPNRFRFTPARNWLRAAALIAFILSLAVGVPWLSGLLEPYSIFGRIVVNFFEPARMFYNTTVAAAGSGTSLTQSGSSQVGWTIFGIALSSLTIIIILSWKAGRAWCNNICPIGTVLGFLSRFQIFRPRIDAAQCTGCGQCEKKCKSQCINTVTMSIDSSRCVSCFNCINICRFHALKYSAKIINENSRWR